MTQDWKILGLERLSGFPVEDLPLLCRLERWVDSPDFRDEPCEPSDASLLSAETQACCEVPALGMALDLAVTAALNWPRRTSQVMLLMQPVPELLSLLPGQDLDPLLPYPAVRKKKKNPNTSGFQEPRW